jgi:hypothetical protein
MTRHTPRALLALISAALCAVALAACGDADEQSSAEASQTLSQMVAATSKIESGKLTASFELAPDGMAALGGAIKLRASGPFTAPAAGELPRTKLAIAGSLGGQAFGATALSTGKRAYLNLDGHDYRVDDELVDAVSKALGNTRGGGFATLGLDPRAWIKNPQDKGEESVGGVDTNRVSGSLDVQRLLADIVELLGSAGGANDFGDFFTPKLRKQIADSVKSAKVDVWTGADDDILRQLEVDLDFAFEKGKAPLPGLDGGLAKLRLRLDDVNATTVDVSALKDARPLSKLFSDGGLGSLLGGLGGSGATTPGGGAAGGKQGEELLKCLQSAGGSSDAIASCAAKLAP